MDEIADCIADHQYGQAIRKTGTVEEQLAASIVDPIPEPPIKNTKREPKRVEAANEWIEEFKKNISFQSMMKRPLGRWFLAEAAKEDEDETLMKKALKTYTMLDDLSVKIAPTPDDIIFACENLMDKVPTDEAKGIVKAISEKAIEAKQASETTESKENSDETTLADCFKELSVNLEKHFNYFEKFQENEVLHKKYVDVSWYEDRPVECEDFIVFRDLGRGAFGVVSGARHRVTGQMVALKGMNRKLVKGKKVTKLVKAEKKILELLGDRPSPFTVWLKYCFMNKESMFMALPLMTGGDLLFHLRNPFSVDLARFYAAEIMLGLDHLHQLGIVYRDLKPENVLLDEFGHTRISDMGLATEIGYTPETRTGKKLKGRAGTPGYWPPEMIQGQGYDFDCDWWSYGVCIYEFLNGFCCFSESHTKMKDRNEATLKWEIDYPPRKDEVVVPDEAKDLLAKLLDKNPETRLGVKEHPVAFMKKHPFFSSLNWNVVSQGKMKPPWAPPKNSINAVAQADLETRNREYEYRKIKLTEEDNIVGLNYTSHTIHQRDLLQVLELDKQGKLNHLIKQQSSTCSVL